MHGDLIISSTPGIKGDTLRTPDNVDYGIFKKLSSGLQRAETEKVYKDEPYILAYWYFYDVDSKPIAITNVRYDKATVNDEDLTNFLIQLAEIYIFFFIVASILAFFLSNYITKSLERIGTRMKNIKIGSKNDLIEWDSNDEIGALVGEYNRMLKEVEVSAQALARSERESAWREMAKQVAHEIKNPLTPMKLRIQHLERAWNDKAPNFDQKLKETARTLVEQIDTLTNIADEFSNFAKMPRAKNEPIDLVVVLKGCIDLFKASQNVKIKFNDPEEELLVNADKDQFIRVFNNLITNGIQSIPEERQGLLLIEISGTRKVVSVTIKDNGSGISQEVVAHLFTPNFTTKTHGAGLGLAMVKNIVENAGGEVSFETKIDEGTTFFLSLPRMANL